MFFTYIGTPTGLLRWKMDKRNLDRYLVYLHAKRVAENTGPLANIYAETSRTTQQRTPFPDTLKLHEALMNRAVRQGVNLITLVLQDFFDYSNPDKVTL